MPVFQQWAKPVYLTAALGVLAWATRATYQALLQTSPERKRLRAEVEQWKRQVRTANPGELWHSLKAMRDWYDQNAPELDRKLPNQLFYARWLSKEWLSFRTNTTTQDDWPKDELGQLYGDINAMKV